jgi:hypothetical protein
VHANQPAPPGPHRGSLGLFGWRTASAASRAAPPPVAWCCLISRD